MCSPRYFPRPILPCVSSCRCISAKHLGICKDIFLLERCNIFQQHKPYGSITITDFRIITRQYFQCTYQFIPWLHTRQDMDNIWKIFMTGLISYNLYNVYSTPFCGCHEYFQYLTSTPFPRLPAIPRPFSAPFHMKRIPMPVKAWGFW